MSPPTIADEWTPGRGGLAGMVHHYAAGVWNRYGVPFDRLLDLGWWDWMVMAAAVASSERRAGDAGQS